MDDDRRENDAENGDDREDQGESPEKTIRKFPEFLRGGIAHVGGEDGNEGGGDDTITNETTKKVGEAISKDESVGGESGAKEEGDALVTDIAENSADDGNQRDDGSRFEDLFLFGQRSPLRDLNPIKTIT